MKKIKRNQIRKIHREIDGFIGRLFDYQKTLSQLSVKEHKDFIFYGQSNLSYSRKSHFSEFHLLPIYQNQNLTTCDLKVYQDLFIYSFIIDNIPQGSKILEIGGGESRIINALKGRYEFWNLDKLEGQGYGPRGLDNSGGFTLIRENIGDFSKNIPENYFDLVFSISVVEHFPEDKKILISIIEDINRILKNNAKSIHCIDALLFKRHIWFHPLLFLLDEKKSNFHLDEKKKNIFSDDKLWTLPRYAYYTRWYPKTRKCIKSFGRPFSLNIYWQNTK